MNKCINKIEGLLGNLPSVWRTQVATAICASSIGGLFDCTDVKANETLTTLSDFTITDTTISISFTDEHGVTVTRTFNFADILNNSIKDLNPLCLATPQNWAAMTYKQKFQLMIDRVCSDCGVIVSGTTSTTAVPTTTTTTSTTTIAPTGPCKQYAITNNTGSDITGTYQTCSFLQAQSTIHPGLTGYICGFEGTVSYVGGTIVDQGACSGVPTTTTTSTITTSTTSTTTIASTAFGGSGRGLTLESAACSDAIANNRTFYTECPNISIGCRIFTDSARTIVLTGFTKVFMESGNWDINPTTGVITAVSQIQC